MAITLLPQKDGVADDYDQHNPEHRQIYKFIRTLFTASQLTAECAIVTLVYLERYGGRTDGRTGWILGFNWLSVIRHLVPSEHLPFDVLP